MNDREYETPESRTYPPKEKPIVITVDGVSVEDVSNIDVNIYFKESEV